MSKERIVVSRKWKHPEITAFVDNQQIGASMSTDDYIDSLVENLSGIPLIMTKEQLVKKLKDAHAFVAEELKTSTQYIV